MAGSGLACETWQLLFELWMAARPRVPLAANQCGLTEAQCHLLRMLEPDRVLPMREAAAALACDASNVTGIVDRLEARGLVERRPSPQDRRVKELVLTAAGAELRGQLLARLAEPPETIARLSAADQRALRAILRKALGRG
jgi:MarR family transcriptional regulator, organic hydroperoxide resistance regulator